MRRMQAKSLMLLMVALVAAKIGLNDLTDRDIFWRRDYTTRRR